MLDEKIKEVLDEEGPVAILTWNGKPHLVGTWSSYIEILDEETLAIPAGGYNTTEENVEDNDEIHLMIGSKDVEGRSGMGAGFRLVGTAEFRYEGKAYDLIKSRFDWARAALVVRVEETHQLL